MDQAVKIDLLKNEYFKLQDIYEDFDKRCHTIKNWSIISSLAAIALGLDKGKPVLFLLAIATALIFWYLETCWKIFQYSNAERLKEIEVAFETDNFSSIQPLQIYSRWFPAYRKVRAGYWGVATQWFVMLPHAFTIGIGAILCFLYR